MSWNYYVGDPCYVIDNDRWGEFCDKLFEYTNPYEGCIVKWEIDGVTYDVECWNSPGGDGVWRFSSYRGECGVDAGLLAIVPREACHDDRGEGMGILFGERPTLESCCDDYWVEINGIRDDSYTECYECGAHTREEMWECECGMTAGCEDCWEGCDDPECSG